MRFFSDGPCIPTRLLAAHERGDVVFLCGAGVSVAAGLPTFEDLARRLVDRLGAPADAGSRLLIERARKAKEMGVPAPTDVVISQLQREYTADQIIQAVAIEPRCPDAYDYSANDPPVQYLLEGLVADPSSTRIRCVCGSTRRKSTSTASASQSRLAWR